MRSLGAVDCMHHCSNPGLCVLFSHVGRLLVLTRGQARTRADSDPGVPLLNANHLELLQILIFPLNLAGNRRRTNGYVLCLLTWQTAYTLLIVAANG